MSAIISPDGIYRYGLSSQWGNSDACLFIMLNPSTADATEDDPTIKRCVTFAKKWGYGSLLVGNLFAFRATSPKDLKKALNPIGPENDDHLEKMCDQAAIIIAAWGQNGKFMKRGAYIRNWASKNSFTLNFLKLSNDGMPHHPLYLKKDLKPQKWIV